MSITDVTKEQLRAAILAIWQAERPDADSTKGSDLWLYARTGSVIAKRLFRTITQGVNALFFNTAEDGYLFGWLSTFGLPDGQGDYGFILPHISSATDGLTCSATGGGPGVLANAWQNQQLTDSAGRTYVCTEAHGAIGAGSSVDLDVESVDTGPGTNLETGVTLTWVAAPAGSDSTAVTAKNLRGGTDLETNSAGQARITQRMRNPPASGNVASFVDVIEAVLPGSLKAYVWPQRQNQPYGYGMTDYCALYTGESGSARHIGSSDDVYDDISDALDAAMPALTYRNSRQLTMSGTDVDVEVTVELGTGATEDQKCDWDAETSKAQVSSTVHATKTINSGTNFTDVSVTNGASVGDKVVINGYEAVIATTPAGNQITVEAWPDEWPTGAAAMNGLFITSGGGFVGSRLTTISGVETPASGLVKAIDDYMDGRGPNVLYNGAQSEIPGWDSSARIQEVESACFVVGGGVIVEVTVINLGGGAVDLVHTAEDGATASIYDVDQVTVWQVYV